jgi:hypothetical protein
MWEKALDDASVYKEKNNAGKITVSVSKPVEIDQEDRAAVKMKSEEQVRISGKADAEQLLVQGITVNRSNKGVLGNVWGSGALPAIRGPSDKALDDLLKTDLEDDDSCDFRSKRVAATVIKDSAGNGDGDDTSDEATLEWGGSGNHGVRGLSRASGTSALTVTAKKAKTTGQRVVPAPKLVASENSSDFDVEAIAVSTSRPDPETPNNRTPSKRRDTASEGGRGVAASRASEFGNDEVVFMKPGEFITKKRAFKQLVASKAASYQALK